MPLWAESRIHGDVYVRFGGRLSETYHRKVAWRRQPSLQITDKKISKDMDNLMAVRMMYGTGKWYKRQGLPKETDLNNEQIGK